MIYQAGGAGPGTPPSNMAMFNATVRHEIGHAVDAQLQVSATWSHQDVAGGWVKYGGNEEFVDAIIRAGGGMTYKDKNDDYRQGMIDAVTHHKSFQQALTAWKDAAREGSGRSGLGGVDGRSVQRWSR